ncbi:TraK family protein [Vibrio parahaemolyticus]|uniref:TraK family protein n=1 Tax=Vibrio parahaemolyticus TaxID=670 RepID=UPI002360EA0D|nr:TraK family protein [Vibrio parahaemolyticus]EJG0778542.1 TraK family protein [Vibrio parahaemolyticus]MBE5149432.1 TraK family protein [Vibrio parahaemolyticus]MDF4719800.1 TraK family protein [Vibrio parahaemolyticus]
MSDCVKKLQAWVIQRQQDNRSPNKQEVLATFLGVKNDVEEAINAGYNLKTIWTYLTEKNLIAFRYETFLRYVKQYITQTSMATPPTKEKSEKSPPSRDMNGFSFNSQPNKEDLI